MRQLVSRYLVWLVGMSASIAHAADFSDTVMVPNPTIAHSLEPANGCTPSHGEECGRFYANVDFLLRWFKPVCASVPIISIGNPQDSVPGALGQPGTQVVIGGVPPHRFEFPMTPGVQVMVGWDRGDGAIGWQVGGFIMEQAANGQRFSADPNGFPRTYLPYQAPDNSFQALPFTVPGIVTGGSTAVGSTHIWGIESNLTVPFAVDQGAYVLYATFLLGGRYLDLTDRVHISNALRLVSNPSVFAFGSDLFSTHNQFGGAQVGSTIGVSWGKCSLELTTKFAGGWTHQTRNIDGSPLLSASALSPNLLPGPLQALPSNISHEKANRITLVPEIGVKTRLELTPSCSLTLGYSLIYWNKVLCPGDQMSPLVNITQLPFHGPVSGPRDPKPLFAHTDYFAQGGSIGIEFRY